MAHPCSDGVVVLYMPWQGSCGLYPGMQAVCLAQSLLLLHCCGIATSLGPCTNSLSPSVPVAMAIPETNGDVRGHGMACLWHSFRACHSSGAGRFVSLALLRYCSQGGHAWGCHSASLCSRVCRTDGHGRHDCVIVVLRASSGAVHHVVNRVAHGLGPAWSVPEALQRVLGLLYMLL